MRSPVQLDQLVSEILSRTRTWPLVGLTPRWHEDHPALSPRAVRQIVGPPVPIYIISSNLTYALQQLLPERLHVFGGAARVWWPLVKPGRDSHSHPLIYDPSGNYGQAALEELAHLYEDTRPPSRTSEARLTRQRDAAEARARGLTMQVHDLAEQLQAVTRERDEQHHDREQPANEPNQRKARAGKKDLASDIERQLHLLIAEQWYEASLNRTDREHHPLGAYVLTPRLLQSLEQRRVDVPPHRVAWVLAMIACGRAPQIAGLAVHPLMTGPGTGTQITRKDGSKGWRCALRHVSGGPRLHYWTHPSGTIEFDAVGQHDEISA